MESTDIRIDVCVATFRRPALLQTLLESLSEQRLEEFISFRVVVVDNDPDESARATLEALRDRLPYPLLYALERQRGISYARNRALECAEADYIAFLDDDEFVEPEWLQQLYDTMQRFNADAVFGPVAAVLPDAAPAWARSHPSFARRSRPSGTSLQSGGTGNVLIRRSALGAPPQRFAETFALTGGGDSDFFYRLHLQGGRLVWCDSAVAYEHVPNERLTTRWVYRRAFRGGQCFARVFVARKTRLSKSVWFVKKVSQVAAGVGLLPFVYAVSYPRYVKLRCRVYAAIGQLTGLVGSTLQYREYESASYRPDGNGTPPNFGHYRN